jgi:hypothetical protein
MFMKTLAHALLVLAIAAPWPALAGSVTGQVTFIGPDSDQVILNQKDAYAVAPGVSLDNVSIRQTITAEVTDEAGVRTITKLDSGPGLQAAQQPVQPAHSLKVLEAKQPVRPKR